MSHKGWGTGMFMARRPGTAMRGAFVLLLIIGGGILPMIASSNDLPDSKTFHLGFSSTTFVNVNQNDAMAAIKVWARVFAKNLGIPTDPVPYLLDGVDQIREAIRSKQVDTVALSVNEFWVLREDMDSKNFIVGITDGDIHEQYVLLVHPESGLTTVSDLMGKRLTLLQNSRMNLAQVWLETTMAQSGCNVEKKITINHAPTISKAVLPLFFRQIDACLVNLRGFSTMCELNPQVGRLQVLATSPSVVPAGFCFRGDYQDSIKESIIKNIDEFVATPAGKQIMTLFQTDALAIKSVSCLGTAFELLEAHQRLCGSSAVSK